MVSIPCNYSVASRLPNLPLFPTPFHLSPPLCRLHFKPRAIHHPINASGADFSSRSSSSSNSPEQIRTLFPGGFKRPEIKVPTSVLRLSTEEVLGGEESTAAISAAVAKGVGIVVLDGGEESGGRVYEAACVLKSVVGDRAYLLISERVDVASAVGASGVVLSDDGIPTIIARNMMMKSKSDTVYLPLVARIIKTVNSAISASSSEGADFLIISTSIDNFIRVLRSSIQHVKVPIFFSIVGLVGDESPASVTSKLLQSGACGVVMSFADMKLFSVDLLEKLSSENDEAVRVVQDGYSISSKMDVEDIRVVTNGKKGIAGFTKLDKREIQLIEMERLLLNEAVAVISKAAPMMKEVSLIADAASRLSEPFLLVIVGEFNSGKSTVINALLGRRYLKEGVVPTTNEITLLSYSEIDSDEQERCERHPDGQFICYLSSPILKEMNLVDTPGTNVILQRQQRLTEEFVPRADLILFTISADRPLTESEVAFLQYVQQWKKKVVFVLNKLDLYRTNSELDEAVAFIKENTRKLLNIEDIRLFPVSARSALEAKLSSSLGDGISYEKVLFDDPGWTTSRFYELEKFLYSFLDGSTDTGMERVRLKLETPIAIADRLLNSCERVVKKEHENAIQNLTSIKDVVSSAKEYAVKMEGESISWRKQMLSLIETAKARAIKLMASTLQLSNIDLISSYAFKGERANSIPATSTVQNEILSPALSDAQKLLRDYLRWLETSNVREASLYMEFFNERWDALINSKERTQSDTDGLVSKAEEHSIKVLESFRVSAAARIFEQEIREAVLGTFGGLGAAGLSASLLTSVLPTTLEDLLALAFCSAGGFLAISNFPSRRKKAVEKVGKVADALARELEDAMQKDLLYRAEKLTHFAEIISKPYLDAVQQNIDRLQEIQGELSNIEQKLKALKAEIQNLHVS
ncbi:probable transmembrane GTPase FZO-like, chloroplastic isoform X1 [Typha angustifolia]|uniref:probable transmembrane GTPase FZO-like, chloroplastic isoform X1 n=1 Tax=Typha angustifolia TaxID=59011 RepID=UPI003C2C95AA